MLLVVYVCTEYPIKTAMLSLSSILVKIEFYMIGSLYTVTFEVPPEPTKLCIAILLSWNAWQMPTEIYRFEQQFSRKMRQNNIAPYQLYQQIIGNMNFDNCLHCKIFKMSIWYINECMCVLWNVWLHRLHLSGVHKRTCNVKTGN